MLRRIRKVAAKRDELIAKEKAKTDAENAALRGPAEPGALRPPERRRRRPTEAAAESLRHPGGRLCGATARGFAGSRCRAERGRVQIGKMRAFEGAGC
jgi:hypothetical protein